MQIHLYTTAEEIKKAQKGEPFVACTEKLIVVANHGISVPVRDACLLPTDDEVVRAFLSDNGLAFRREMIHYDGRGHTNVQDVPLAFYEVTPR